MSTTIITVNGQNIPMTTNSKGQKTLELDKMDTPLTRETLELLCRAETNPVTASFMKDGKFLVAALDRVLPGVHKSVREAIMRARSMKAEMPPLDGNIAVCPVCGWVLYRSGVNHLTQKHGKLYELESAWGLEPGDLSNDLFIHASLKPVFAENGAKGEAGKKAKAEKEGEGAETAEAPADTDTTAKNGKGDSKKDALAEARVA
jgi:hypothetical protein